MALHNVSRSHTPSLAGGECAPRPRRQQAPAKGQRVGDRSVCVRCRAQAGAPPPYVETSQKAPSCPAASCGACPGTIHGTSCSFRSVSEGCISRRGGAPVRLPAIHATAAEPGSLRPPNRAPRTLRTIPSRPTTQKTRLERGQKPPPPQKHAKCTKRRTHLKHSTPTTQQARVGASNGGFCVSR